MPGYQRDTITSFTSRAIARSMPKTPFDERHKDSLTQACKIRVPRVYKDPTDNDSLRLRTPRGDRTRQRSQHNALELMTRSSGLAEAHTLQTTALFQDFGISNKFSDTFNHMMY